VHAARRGRQEAQGDCECHLVFSGPGVLALIVLVVMQMYVPGADTFATNSDAIATIVLAVGVAVSALWSARIARGVGALVSLAATNQPEAAGRGAEFLTV